MGNWVWQKNNNRIIFINTWEINEQEEFLENFTPEFLDNINTIIIFEQ